MWSSAAPENCSEILSRLGSASARRPAIRPLRPSSHLLLRVDCVSRCRCCPAHLSFSPSLSVFFGPPMLQEEHIASDSVESVDNKAIGGGYASLKKSLMKRYCKLLADDTPRSRVVVVVVVVLRNSCVPVYRLRFELSPLPGGGLFLRPTGVFSRSGSFFGFLVGCNTGLCAISPRQPRGSRQNGKTDSALLSTLSAGWQLLLAGPR